MVAALAWVAVWLVLGLVALSGKPWSLGWGGAVVATVLLWPTFAGGYLSLRTLFGRDAAERDEEIAQTAWDSVMGLPLVIVSFVWSVMVLGALRFMGGFEAGPKGSFMHFLMSVFALHLIVWGGTALVGWLTALRRGEF